MLNDFEAENIKRAKKILEKDLSMAAHIHKVQQEKQKLRVEKTSLWGKVRSFFSNLF